MVNGFENLCRLCFLRIEDFRMIEEDEADVLKVLNIRLDLSVTYKPIICTPCWSKVGECFEFKSRCIYTEDFLVPFVKEGTKLDLKDMFLRTEEDCGIKTDLIVCRLCMFTAEDSYILSDSEEEYLRNFFPEIDLHSIENSCGVCSKCHLKLNNYFDFVKLCLDREEKFQSFHNNIPKEKRENNTELLREFMQSIEEIPQLGISEDDDRNINIKQEDEIDIEYHHLDNGVQADGEKSRGRKKCSSANRSRVCKTKTPKTEGNNYCEPDKSNTTTKRGRRRSNTSVKLLREEQSFVCKHCHKKCTKSSELIRHLRVHSGEKPFLCQHCGKCFSLNANLKNHRRIHTGEKPFPCESCSKSFIQKTKLEIHQRIHTREKPFLCEYCNKSFSRKDVLVIHQRMHTGERPYMCPFCNRSFFSKSPLVYHINICDGASGP